MITRWLKKRLLPNKDEEARSTIESLVAERDQQAALLSAIYDAVLAVDLNGAPLFFNSRFALLFEDKELQDRKVWKIIQDTQVLEAYQSALKDGKSSSVKATPIEQSTGTRFFSVSVSPLRRPSSDQIYGAVGIFHEVTDLKRAEQIRIDFVANVSHELRTPLTAIKGYTDTLLEDVRTGLAPEPGFIERIARNTDRLMSLIDDLLDLSAIESTDVIQKSPLSTEEITSRITKQLQGAFEAKKLRLQTRYQARSVVADPRRLEQILVNLLDNAVKYSPIGGQIDVLWESSPARKTILLRVKDDGPGIPVEHHSRLFERFYRVDKARSREMGGTGLGLAIVKHIMQRHDGTIWVESAPGQGSIFICEFPAN